MKEPSTTLEETEMLILIETLNGVLTHFSNLPTQDWEKEMWDYHHILQNIKAKLEQLVEKYQNTKNQKPAEKNKIT